MKEVHLSMLNGTSETGLNLMFLHALKTSIESFNLGCPVDRNSALPDHSKEMEDGWLDMPTN